MPKHLPPAVTLFAAFTLLTVAWTWPLVTCADRAFLQLTATPSPLVLADHYLTSWILSWGAHQLRDDPFALFEANIFYPFAHSLAIRLDRNHASRRSSSVQGMAYLMAASGSGRLRAGASPAPWH